MPSEYQRDFDRMPVEMLDFEHVRSRVVRQGPKNAMGFFETIIPDEKRVVL